MTKTEPSMVTTDCANDGTNWVSSCGALECAFSSSISGYAYTVSPLNGQELSCYLTISGFGFTLPVGCTVDQILVSLYRRGNLGVGNDIEVYLKYSNSLTENGSTSMLWSLSYVWDSFLPQAWSGTSWDSTKINNSAFGLVIAVRKITGGGSWTPFIDQINITVQYTPAPPPTTSQVTSGQITTNQVTTRAITTAATTRGLTTSPVFTTSEVTTRGLTTSPIFTTRGLTTSPFATTGEVTTGEITTTPVTTNQITTFSISTGDVSPDVTTSTPYSGSTTSIVTTSPATSGTNLLQENSGKSSTNSSNRTLIAGIVGGLVAIVAVIAVVLSVILVVRKRSRKSNVENSSSLELVKPESQYGTSHLSTRSISPPKKSSVNSNLNLWLKDVEVSYKIGGGKFGEVFKGTWKASIEVALKKMRLDDDSEFQKEAETLSKLEHRHIVHFFGIFQSPAGDKYLVLEYMNQGSLLNLLQENEGKVSIRDLMSLSLQTSAGMLYLHQNKIVHRDLALRNILVNKSRKDLIAKVSDFGMSRQVQDDYYRSDNKDELPVKWCSPEVLKWGKFSAKSDAFAFGVVLWEIFSFGAAPYSGMSNYDTAQKIKEGFRMEAPKNMPSVIVSIMQNCWKESPDERPDFQSIHDTLHKETAHYTRATVSSSIEINEYSVEIHNYATISK